MYSKTFGKWWNASSIERNCTSKHWQHNSCDKNAPGANWFAERDHDNDASLSTTKSRHSIEPRGTISGIARQLQIGKPRVRTFLAAKSFPEWGRAQQTSSAIDPSREALKQHWDQGCRSPQELWQHLQAARGFSGGYMLVYRWVQLQREVDEVALNQSQDEKGAPANSMAPRHLSWSFLRDSSRLEKQEQEKLSLIRQEENTELVYSLTQQFVRMGKERKAELLSTWLGDCHRSGITELVNFAQGLEKEGSALHAALTLPYSNGPVEGKINTLKYMKRSMDGRSGFPLLRQKVLKAA